jgi:hypothetical protein
LRSALLFYDLIRDLDNHGNVREEEDENTEDEEAWQRPIWTPMTAAARRFDEAQDALAAFVELEASGQETLYTHQLRRWIERRGDPGLTPSEP